MSKAQEPVSTVIRLAMRAARRIGAEGGAARAAAQLRLHELAIERDEAVAAVAEERARTRRLARLSWIPFLVPRRLADSHLALDALEADVKKITHQAQRQRRREIEIVRICDSAARVEDRLRRGLRAVPQIGQPSLEIENRFAEAGAVLRFLLRSDSRGAWATQALAASESVIAILRDWVQSRAAIEATRRVQAPASPAIAQPADKRRVYLPIPRTLETTAARLGAIKDPDSPKGASPWYATLDMDLSKFGNLLPLAYRARPTRFSFPPIPYRAAGQNLWSMFERDSTWDPIRRASYAASGRRCAICGNRDGFIAKALAGTAGTRGPIECHEIWDWEMPDPASGVGVQTLKGMITVCPSCHAMFHSGHFMRAAREAGNEQQVADFIERRRMLVNRVDTHTLAAQLAEDRQTLSDVSGATDWVIDLSHLSGQVHLGDRPPVLLERNPARIRPDQIAGISFDTDFGAHHSLRDAEDVLAALSGRDSGSAPRR